MAKETKPAKSLQYRMRAIHRVLGFLAIGMVMVYALSGIMLIHRTGDFMKRATAVESTIEKNLDADGLAATLRVKNLKVTEETDTQILFAEGSYDKLTGSVSYTRKEYVKPFDKFVTLHKLPDAKNPHVAFVTTLFGVVLFLLALTSLFMFKTSSRQFRSGMVYTAAGVVLTVLLLLLV